MFKAKDAVTSYDGRVAFREYSKKIHRGAMLCYFSNHALLSFIEQYTGDHLILAHCKITRDVLRELNKNVHIQKLTLAVKIPSRVTYLELPPNLVHLDISNLLIEHTVYVNDHLYIENINVGDIDPIKLHILKKIRCDTITVNLQNYFDAVFLSTINSNMFIITTTPAVACNFIRCFKKNNPCKFRFLFTNKKLFDITYFRYLTWKLNLKSNYYYIN